MLTALDGYAVLLLVPVTCVPLQLLYLKAGQRYDLGAGTYVSAGTFLAASLSVHAERAIALRMASILLVTLLGAFALRLFALAFGRPADFTLISFGLLWATPALIDYELQGLTKASGIPLEPVNCPSALVALTACGIAVLLAYAIRRTTLPERLVALTEAPVQYRLLFGSPVQLALRLELLAFSVFFSAGILLRLTIHDLSADTFGAESIWCVLAAAPASRSWVVQTFGTEGNRHVLKAISVLLGPLAAMLLRFLIKSIVSARFAAVIVYAALAVVLIVVSAVGEEASRDAIA